MPGLLGFLQAGLTPATQAAGGYLQGQERGRKDNEATMLKQIELLRQKHIDEQNKALNDAQIGNYKSLAEDRLRVAPETFGDFEQVYDPKTKTTRMVQRGNRNTIRDTGYEAPPKEETFGAPFNATQKGQPGVFERGNHGTIRPIQGMTPYESPTKGSAGKPPKTPTEGQEKSYIFAGLMKTGEKEVDDAWATGKVRPGAITAFLRSPGIVDAGVNAFLNPEEQKYIRGLRSFTAGALRKETGAAFSKQELSEQHGRYFAGFGDSPEMVAPKKKARGEYIGMMEQSALPAKLYYDAVKGNGIPRITQEEEATGGTGEFAGSNPSRSSHLSDAQVSEALANGAKDAAGVRSYWAKKKP